MLLSETVIVSEVAKISHTAEFRTRSTTSEGCGRNPIAYISFSMRNFASFGLNKIRKTNLLSEYFFVHIMQAAEEN